MFLRAAETKCREEVRAHWMGKFVNLKIRVARWARTFRVHRMKRWVYSGPSLPFTRGQQSIAIIFLRFRCLSELCEQSDGSNTWEGKDGVTEFVAFQSWKEKHPRVWSTLLPPLSLSRHWKWANAWNELGAMVRMWRGKRHEPKLSSSFSLSLYLSLSISPIWSFSVFVSLGWMRFPFFQHLPDHNVCLSNSSFVYLSRKLQFARHTHHCFSLHEIREMNGT